METTNSQYDKAWTFLFLAWIIALTSTLGSLFFSEVMKYPPCILCWYQRICMYPLVPIFLVGLFPLDRKVFKFSLPLVIGGWLIAFYQTLLYYKVLPESAAPCQQGISCTAAHIDWLGFLSIPLLSLLGFTAILTLLILTFRKTAP